MINPNIYDSGEKQRKKATEKLFQSSSPPPDFFLGFRLRPGWGGLREGGFSGRKKDGS